MKPVALTNSSEFALVDEADFERVSAYKWCLHSAGYAQCTRHIQFRMLHHFILGTTREVDHKNLNKLDNRRANLRKATRTQNKGNTNKRNQKCSSQFKGVYWTGRSKPWAANITINGKPKYLGMFNTEIEAAKAYDTTAKEIFGEFAKTNF